MARCSSRRLDGERHGGSDIRRDCRLARTIFDESTGTASRYQVLWAHAKGGLGEVFLAEDTELHRRVALKEIQARHAKNPVSRERFVAEAEITGNLEHPGVVPVYGLGTHRDGRPFYAMRFIKGEDLATAIRQVSLGPRAEFHRTGVSLAVAQVDRRL